MKDKKESYPPLIGQEVTIKCFPQSPELVGRSGVVYRNNDVIGIKFPNRIISTPKTKKYIDSTGEHLNIFGEPDTLELRLVLPKNI